MKKFLPIIAFVSAVVASFLYLLPSFHVSYKGNTYVFNNLSSFSERSLHGLQVQIARLSPSYKYVIESSTNLNDRDWVNLATRDQKTLERRLESFIGKSFEVRLDNKDGLAVFSVFTRNPLGSSTTVLTTNNGDFAVSSQEPAAAATEEEAALEAAAQKNLEKLDLKRSDFGAATISATQQNQGVQYQIKLPVGIVTPEKINLIKAKAGLPINVFIGGKDYSASFLTNLNGAPTDLVLTSAASVDEAASVQTYLNTDPYYLGYKLTSTEVYQPKHVWAKLGGLIALFVAAAIVLNRFTSNTVSVRKLLLIASYVLLGLATLKLLGLVVTTGVVVVLTTVVLMTLLNVRYLYFLGFGVSILLMQLLGYLYFLELNWTQIIIILITSGLIWSTNYYGSNNQK